MTRSRPQRRSRRTRKQAPEIVRKSEDEDSDEGTQQSKDEATSDSSDDDVPLSKLLPQKKASMRKRGKASEKSEDDEGSSSEADTGSDSRKRSQRRGRSATKSVESSDTGESLRTNEDDSSDDNSDSNRKTSKRQPPKRRGKQRKQEKVDSPQRTPKRRGGRAHKAPESSSDEEQVAVKTRTSKRQGKSASKRVSKEDEDSDTESMEQVGTGRSTRNRRRNASQREKYKKEEEEENASTGKHDENEDKDKENVSGDSEDESASSSRSKRRRRPTERQAEQGTSSKEIKKGEDEDEVQPAKKSRVEVTDAQEKKQTDLTHRGAIEATVAEFLASRLSPEKSIITPMSEKTQDGKDGSISEGPTKGVKKEFVDRKEAVTKADNDSQVQSKEEDIKEMEVDVYSAQEQDGQVEQNETTTTVETNFSVDKTEEEEKSSESYSSDKESRKESDESHDANTILPESRRKEIEATVFASGEEVDSIVVPDDSEANSSSSKSPTIVKESKAEPIQEAPTQTEDSLPDIDVSKDDLMDIDKTSVSVAEPIEMVPSLDEEKDKKVGEMKEAKREPVVMALPFKAPRHLSVLPNTTPLFQSYDQNKLKKVKAILYSAGGKVHRGRGFERIFAQYWDAVSLQLSDRLSPHESHQCRLAVKAFLTSAKLRRIHNKFIFSIMKSAMKSFAPFDEVSRYIPSKWHRRVKTIALTHYITEAPKDESSPALPKASGKTTPCAYKVQPESIYSEAWERNKDTVQLVSFADMDEAKTSTGTKMTKLPSSWVPGALVIDPMVRKNVENRGMRVSENAVWLLVVAVREYAKSVMKNALIHKKARDEGKIPVPFLRYPNVLASSRQSKKDSGQDKQEATSQPDDSHVKTKKKVPMTALDIFASSASMPIGRAGSIGGALSSQALERCLYSAYNSLPSVPGKDFTTVQNYITAEIASLARDRKSLAPPKPRAEITDHRVSRQPIRQSPVQISPQDVMLDPSLQPRPISVQIRANSVSSLEHSNVIIGQAKAPAIPPPAIPSRADSQNSVNGLGRGAKNLAALIRRESTGDVSATANVSDIQQNDSANATKEETQSSEAEQMATARRGKGFGTKDLAAMRARSIQKSTDSPDEGNVDGEGKKMDVDEANTIILEPTTDASNKEVAKSENVIVEKPAEMLDSNAYLGKKEDDENEDDKKIEDEKNRKDEDVSTLSLPSSRSEQKDASAPGEKVQDENKPTSNDVDPANNESTDEVGSESQETEKDVTLSAKTESIASESEEVEAHKEEESASKEPSMNAEDVTEQGTKELKSIVTDNVGVVEVEGGEEGGEEISEDKIKAIGEVSTKEEKDIVGESIEDTSVKKQDKGDVQSKAVPVNESVD